MSALQSALSGRNPLRELEEARRARAHGRRYMDWEKSRESDNVVVEDGSGGGRGGFGGIHLGLGGVALVVVLSLLFGKNPIDMLSLISGTGAPTVQQAPARPADARLDAANPQVRF